jgi:hypothetical protein
MGQDALVTRSPNLLDMTSSSDDEWRRLRRVTKSHPFFLARPVLCVGGARDVIRERRSRLVGGAVMLAMTAGLITLAWRLSDDGDADAATYIGIVIWTLFAAGFGFLSCLVLLRVRRLEFDRFNQSLFVYSGYFPFVRRAEISTKDIDATLSANRESTRTTLTLRRSDAPESPVDFARAEFKSELETVYIFLRQWFSGGHDDTLVSVTAPNGKLIEFATTPINPIGSNFETACLTADSGGRLAIRATRQIRAFWLAFATLGAMILVFLRPAAVKEESVVSVAIAGSVGSHP